MSETLRTERFFLDPHGACGYQALVDGLQPGETGICLETAHPAKFLETVESAIVETISVPEKLQVFMRVETQSILMPAGFNAFKHFLLNHQ